MAASNSILLAVHPLRYQGENILAEHWASLCADLRNLLQGMGEEGAASSEELLLFHFDTLPAALNALAQGLAHVKREYQWQKALGPVPLQIVLHLEKSGDLPGPMHEAGANFWDLLQPEQTYVTRPLKLQWTQLATSDALPAHSFAEADNGLSLLTLSEAVPLRGEPLFPHRGLPIAGKLRPCFYCGMTGHKPAGCPSKMLTMSTQGILLAGYLPLEHFTELFARAMSAQEKLNSILAAGLTPSQLRQNPLLQVYVSYFDLNRTFQLRFLWNIAFTTYSNWDELAKPDTLSVDSHGLHMGLDCLRVGQHNQAEELFVEECRRPKGRQFYATIGRAFVALELERDSDMGHFLESAQLMANSDKEKIYISLLQSRYFALHEDSWKAEHALDNVFSLRRDLPEALYRRLQLMSQRDMGEKGVRQLRILFADQKELFLAALMDPQLLPIAGQIEDALLAHQQIQRQEAEEQLGKARAVCADLATWFTEDQEELRSFLADLAGLEKQFERGSYFDNLDVAHKARSLLHACYRLQENKLDEMKAQIDKLVTTWEAYRLFWKNYPYQRFFQDFQQELQADRDRLNEIEKQAERNMHGQLFRNIQEMMEQIRTSFDLLKPLAVRMGWVKIFFDGAKLFGRRLLIAEAILLGCGAVLVPILAFWLAGTDFAGLIELIKNPSVQKQALLVVTLLLAPFLALAQTLWQMMEN
ncbi:hypothetical protein ACUUL3_15295 [Thiovibrio sp. JS02]